MVSVDLETLRRVGPVSHVLLTHGGLMTHHLVRLFGPVHAVASRMERKDNTITRWSTLHQTATGAALLQARLVIATPNLPDGVIDQLLSGSRLFGGLLTEAGVAVRMTDRVIYQAGLGRAADTGCWGRRQRILRALDGALLCDVDECLSTEAALQRQLIAPLAGLGLES